MSSFVVLVVRAREAIGLEGLGLALLILIGVGVMWTLSRYFLRRRSGDKFVPRSVP